MDKYISIVIYLVTFFISASFFELRKRVTSKEKKIVVLISVLLPSLIAGFRGDTVGTDVMVYVKPLYEGALRITGFASYMTAFPKIDFGYLCIVYYTTKIFKEMFAVLFVTALVTYIPIFYIAEYFEKEKGIKGSTVLLCYYLLFFNLTLNAVRQSVAISLILLFFVLVNSNKIIKALVTAVVAQAFHNSAVLGILIVIFSIFIYRVENQKKRFVYMSFFILAFATIASNVQNIITFFIQKGLFSEKMNVYVDIFFGGNSGTKSYMFQMSTGMILVLILKIGTLVLPVILGTMFIKDKTFEMIKINTIIGIASYAIMYLIFQSIYVYRITLYGEVFAVLLMSYSGSNIVENRKFTVSRRNAIIVGYALVYWYINYAMLGLHQTLPYCLSK